MRLSKFSTPSRHMLRCVLSRLYGQTAITGMVAVLTGCAAGSLNWGVPAGTDGSTTQSFQRAQFTAGSALSALGFGVRAAARPARFIHPVTRLPLGPFGFVSDQFLNVVYLVNDGDQVTNTLQSPALAAPSGMAVTNRPRRLYVANEANRTVAVFASSSAPQILGNGGVTPSDVAVDRNGSLATMNLSGTINCFVGGATSPSFTIEQVGERYPIFFGAFDQAGNLFIDGFNFNSLQVHVAEVVGGCGNPHNTITPLSTTNQLGGLGSIDVAPEGNIIVDDSGNAALYTYRPPVGDLLGPPVTTPLDGTDEPISSALSPGLRDVITADIGLDGGSAIDIFPYPEGGPYLKSTVLFNDESLPYGTATYPSTQF